MCTRSSPSDARTIEFKWLTLRDLTPRVTDQWSALAHSACTPNVYLTPDFLIPALRFLHFDGQPRIAVACDARGTRMLALGVFIARAPSLRFPFPALEFARSLHSFQSGLLVSSDLADRDVDSYLGHLLADGRKALIVRDMQRDSACFERLIRSAARLKMSWIPQREYQRAALVNGDDTTWRRHVSHSMYRKLRRNFRRLQQFGEVAVRLVLPEEITATHTETFLALEDTGWRRSTSLLSDPLQAEFFRSTVDRLRGSRNVFFVELTVGGQVIASTVNFYFRDRGFGFKIGWDPAYRKFAPGFLVEFGLLEICAEGRLPARCLESGADEGSYLEALWPSRVTMVHGSFVSGIPASVVMRATNTVRRWAKTLRARRGPDAPGLPGHFGGPPDSNRSVL